MPHSQVEASGNRVVLHFDSLEDAMRLLSPRRGSKPPIVAAEGIHAALGAAGLAMEIRVGGHMLVKLGATRSVLAPRRDLKDFLVPVDPRRDLLQICDLQT